MANREVLITGHIAAEPADVWARISNFCDPWHPLIAQMRAGRSDRGALVRTFRARGEDTLYREQLTYVSNSDRVLRYTHLEGIAGAQAYDAELNLTPSPAGGSDIRWQAWIEASEDRADEIAEGTRSIFAMGLEALQAMRLEPAAPDVPLLIEEAELASLTLAGSPDLSLIATPAKSGPLLLFLHGIGGAAANWQPQLGAAGTLMQAAALDLRGYGGSGLGERQSTIGDYCDDILRVAEHFEADRIILAGLSYGSWIATSFAMSHPDRLAGLVLSGGCTGMSQAGAEERAAFRQAREAPLDAGKRPADFAPEVVEMIAGPETDEPIRKFLRDSMAAIPAATYRDALTCFTSPTERFDFSRLTMPVLLMTGEHDRLASPDEMRGVAEKIVASAPAPSVRFEVIAGAGHVCNLEKPQSYNVCLIRFLKEILE